MAELDAIFDRAHQVLVRLFNELQVRPHQGADPRVGLTLGVNAEAPALRAGSDDSVLDGEGVCGEALLAPLTDPHRIRNISKVELLLPDGDVELAAALRPKLHGPLAVGGGEGT